jgi:hypothetical protein
MLKIVFNLEGIEGMCLEIEKNDVNLGRIAGEI